MLDQLSESRLSQVHPQLSRRIHNLAAAIPTITLRVTAGIRTIAQQDALWQLGRDAQGKKIGITVTDAKGAQSNHVLGYAADLAVMENGQPNWKLQPWIALAPQFSLRSGLTFEDGPHLELIEVPADPPGEVQQQYLSAGLAAVWSAANISQTV